MISVSLGGGLGNMMFQVAFIQSLGRRYSLDAGYANAVHHINWLACLKRSPYARDYFNIFKHVDFAHINTNIQRSVRVPLKYTPVAPVDGVNYEGYFASERNFFSRQFVLDLFEPAEWLKGVVDVCVKRYHIDKHTAAVHVRRADFVGNGGFTQIGMDYYTRAMRASGAERFLVFSDDLPWCRQHFVGPQFEFVSDKDYVEMMLISRCPVIITTNSTFSWWGAYLNVIEGCKIYTPLYWFPVHVGHTDDVVPKHWTRI